MNEFGFVAYEIYYYHYYFAFFFLFLFVFFFFDFYYLIINFLFFLFASRVWHQQCLGVSIYICVCMLERVFRNLTIKKNAIIIIKTIIIKIETAKTIHSWLFLSLLLLLPKPKYIILHNMRIMLVTI